MMKSKSKLLIIFILLLISTIVFSAELDDYQSFLQKGWQERQNKNYDNAISAYQKAISLNNDGADGYIGLLWTYIEKEDFVSAEKLADKILLKFSDNLWIRKGAAWTYFKRNRFSDAAKNYRFVLKEGGEDKEIRIGLILSLYKERDISSAKSEYEKLDSASKDDSRLSVIHQKTGWVFKPMFFGTYKRLLEPVERSYIFALNIGAEIYHSSGIGFFADLSLLFSDMPKQSASKRSSTSMEILPGVSVFYAREKYMLWTRYSLLSGTKNEKAGHAFNLYGNYNIEPFFIGMGFDLGLYDGYNTIQFSPEIGFRINQTLFIKAVPIIQKNSGVKPGSLTMQKTRFSLELDFELKFKIVRINISGYYGLRWYTSENRGILIWNSDEELNWGLKLKTLFLPDSSFSPYILVRLDNAIKQKGIEKNTGILSITGGFIFTF